MSLILHGNNGRDFQLTFNVKGISISSQNKGTTSHSEEIAKEIIKPGTQEMSI